LAAMSIQCPAIKSSPPGALHEEFAPASGSLHRHHALLIEFLM